MSCKCNDFDVVNSDKSFKDEASGDTVATKVMKLCFVVVINHAKAAKKEFDLLTKYGHRAGEHTCHKPIDFKSTFFESFLKYRNKKTSSKFTSTVKYQNYNAQSNASKFEFLSYYKFLINIT